MLKLKDGKCVTSHKLAEYLIEKNLIRFDMYEIADKTIRIYLDENEESE